ncbi:MAG: ribonucleotide reductase subunit alpha [Gammaproteobacteria bacterium]|nr:MAG: ribonucleotide reductase subunit alpha [Gammaproteobacteria bacterium]
MNITNYESLLSAAKQQPEPQRLLFVFLKASLPKDHEGDEESRFNAGQGGELEPVMCVDKALDELGSFSDLVEESKQMQQDWQLVLIAALSGRNGITPSSAEAEKSLKMMLHVVENGGDLSRYITFDRDGIPVQFG